jgi:hypothetical protein
MTDDMLLQQILSLDGTTLALVFVLLVVASLPPFFVLYSRRVHGGQKLLWFILTGTFSWLAYIPFLLMTRRPQRDETPPQA